MTDRYQRNISEPKLVKDEATLLKVQELRRSAWLENGEIPEFIERQNVLTDPHDVHGMHWAIFCENRPVAAARMCIHDSLPSSPDSEAYEGYEQMIEPPIASLTRLVVASDFRRLGLGQKLRQIRLDCAAKADCRSIVTIAEESFVIRAWEARGFECLGRTRMQYVRHLPSFVLLKRALLRGGANGR